VIAVDTNVLLRRLLNDDATQAEKALRLFEMQESVLVTDVVLAETIWTLTGKRYGAGKKELAAVVMGLLEEGNVVFESRQAVWSALNDYVDALPVKTVSGVRPPIWRMHWWSIRPRSPRSIATSHTVAPPLTTKRHWHSKERRCPELVVLESNEAANCGLMLQQLGGKPKLLRPFEE
jgi:predicted nucleic-acid-binding protein